MTDTNSTTNQTRSAGLSAVRRSISMGLIIFLRRIMLMKIYLADGNCSDENVLRISRIIDKLINTYHANC